MTNRWLAIRVPTYALVQPQVIGYAAPALGALSGEAQRLWAMMLSQQRQCCSLSMYAVMHAAWVAV